MSSNSFIYSCINVIKCSYSLPFVMAWLSSYPFTICQYDNIIFFIGLECGELSRLKVMSYKHYSRRSIILPVCEGSSSIKNPNFCSPAGAKRSVKILIAKQVKYYSLMFSKFASNMQIIYVLYIQLAMHLKQ